MRPKIGVEPFDVGYGASFAATSESQLAKECPLVEDGGHLIPHDPPREVQGIDRVAFVDGTMRTEARLTRVEPDGTVTPGIAGTWAAGAALAWQGKISVDQDRIRTGRATIFGGGASTRLPDQPGGWSWTAHSTDKPEPERVRQGLQDLMRAAEGTIAESLCDGGCLTVVDGPLSYKLRDRTVPIIGYVKTHHRRMLDVANWARVPDLRVGQRSSLFQIEEEKTFEINRFACYLRVGDPGPWSSPWAGIARLEVPAGAGESAAITALDSAAVWLPRYASAPHRDPRAPVNLAPIAGLEHHLRRCSGNAALALRAVRAAVLALNNTALDA